MRDPTARSATVSDTRELGDDRQSATSLSHSGALPVSGEPAATLREISPYWLDRLIVASCQLPITDGPEAVMRSIVEVVTSLLPGYRVGARVTISDAGLDGAMASALKVIRSEPPKSDEQLRGVSRLFPDWANERAISLPGDFPDAAIHLAGNDPALDDASSSIVYFLNRAALVAADGLRRARQHEMAALAHNELRALRSHMVQAEKLASLGQIAAGMVHELNNPLTSIVAYTDYLIRRSMRATETSGATPGGAVPDPDDVERLRRIAESANRMLRFTRDLVSYARPSSEVAVPVPLHAVINRALAFCEHELAEAGAAVECDFDDGVHSVRGMPEQLAQIFVNLVTNACHAMAAPPQDHAVPRAGRLTVSTRLVDGSTRVRIVVEDTGHGISPAHLPLVFAPFFTTKGAGRGTGLGLSIVKNIVENHAGDIKVESDPSHGARFIILLPVDPRG